MITLVLCYTTLSVVSSAAVPSLTEIPSSWLLPNENTTLSKKESECLSSEQVYWPSHGQCHNLLTRGPCDIGEWLVLDKNPGGERVICKSRICPCNSHHPTLCEVEVENSSCQCKVSLAAAQDGICEVGEQLLVSPYGKGLCDCITSPLHARWPGDGNCYPLYGRGPCQPGFVLSYSQQRFEFICKPALCGEGYYLWKEDGKCHALGSQGPCDEVEVFQIDGETLEVGCKVNENVARVYDILPTNEVSFNSIVAEEVKLVKMEKCLIDSRGKCRKLFPGIKKRGRKQRKQKRWKNKKVNPKKYLKWLKQFR